MYDDKVSIIIKSNTENTSDFEKKILSEKLLPCLKTIYRAFNLHIKNIKIPYSMSDKMSDDTLMRNEITLTKNFIKKMSEDLFICSIKISDICQITDDIKVSICYSFNYSAIHVLQGPNYRGNLVQKVNNRRYQ